MWINWYKNWCFKQFELTPGKKAEVRDADFKSYIGNYYEYFQEVDKPIKWYKSQWCMLIWGALLGAILEFFVLRLLKII